MKKETMDKFLAFCKEMEFDITAEDSRQRQAVFSNDKFVIPAGAGSGKTTVLTYRFLRLLMDEDIETIHSDEILTLTFTKAATANMKSKIFKTLKLANERKLIREEELDRFSKAEISTTDSFCSKIVRMDSVRYGIAPDFSIEEDEDYNAWATEEVRRIILDALKEKEGESEDEKTQREEIRAIVSRHGLERLTGALITSGSNYLDISSYSSDEEAMVKSLLSSFENETMGLKEEKEKTLDTLISEMVPLTASTNADEDSKKLDAFWEKYTKEGIFETPKFTLKRSLGRKNAEEDARYMELKAAIKEEVAALKAILDYSASDTTLLSAWGRLLSRFYSSLVAHKKETGLLTFRDILLLSIDILRTNSEIRSYYNKKYKRIMVDEFQDNNGENKNLIYLIAAKDSYKGGEFPTNDDIHMEKIFMVGDEKQSIYRFRGADVSVFKNISKDFGEEHVLSLVENFRSEKTLIDNINTMFSGSVISLNPEKDFEAQYKSLVSNVNKTSHSNLRFLWMDWHKQKNEEIKDCMNLYTDQHLSEAYEVARYIKEEIMANPKSWPVATKKGERDPEYSDIAILLRKGSNQGDFERALRHFGIPFNVTENKSLTMDATCSDFYNVLQLLSYGKDEDTVSFASFLRSPFANLSNDGIRIVMTNLREKRELSEGLNGDDTLLLEFGLETLEGALAIAEKGKITPILSYLWLDRGYRYFIEGKEENKNFSEHYDYIFSLASSYDESGRTLVEYLDRIRPYLGKESRLKDINIQREEKSGVTIQTIHKSKGLEYPIVFVSDTSAKGGGSNDTLTIVPDINGNPTIPFVITDEDSVKNPWEKFISFDENEMENAELKRLLYVAATRAEHHLIFTGAIENEADEDSKAKTRNLLYYTAKGLKFSIECSEKPKRHIKHHCSFIGTSFKEQEFFPVLLSTFRNERKSQLLTAEDEWYTDNPERKESVGAEKLGVTTLIERDDISSTILKKEKKEKEEGVKLPRISIDPWLVEINEEKVEGETEEEREESRKTLMAERIAEFGTLVHKTLEDKISGSDDDYSSFFKGEEMQKKAIEEALSLRDGFFSSCFYKNTLSSFTLTPERSFMVKDGNNIVEGIIDLFCEKDDEIFIVDYKTDHIRYDSSHRDQLNYYRAALKTIFPEKRINAAVFYLRDPENVLIIEE